MLIIFLLLGIFAYFFVMAICMIIAMLAAKRNIAWFAYGVGAIYQLVKLVTGQEIAFVGSPSLFVWLVSGGILAVSLLVILLRRKPKKQNPRPY